MIPLKSEGGNFLASDLTAERFRQTLNSSKFWPCYTLEQWQAQGSPKADELLRSYTLKLLDDLGAPADHGALMAQGEAFIQKLKLP